MQERLGEFSESGDRGKMCSRRLEMGPPGPGRQITAAASAGSPGEGRGSAPPPLPPSLSGRAELVPGLRADGTVRSASVLSDRHWNPPPHPTPGPQEAECADSQSALGWGGASVWLTGVQVTRRPGREDHFKERGAAAGGPLGGGSSEAVEEGGSHPGCAAYTQAMGP